MREIKFRAWDKVKNKMLNIKKVEWHATDGFYSHVNGISCHANKDIILMQYTGLKDKNGKEIYEGDIVKYTMRDNFGGETGTSVVRWNDNCCGFRPFSCDYELDKREFEIIEIIGNIYENPELIE